MSIELRSSIDIRELGVSDVAGYRELGLQWLRDSPASFGSSYEEEAPRTAKDIEQQFRERLFPTNAIFGVFDGPKLVGLVGIRLADAKKRAHKTHLWGMYVDADYQRCGIGSRLVERAITFARDIPGAQRVELGVETTNIAATRLYERFGFTTWGTEPQALRVGHQYYDEHFMTKEL